MRKTHGVRIVRVRVVVFLLFWSEFMAMLASILSLYFVREVDLEKLGVICVACYIVTSICD